MADAVTALLLVDEVATAFQVVRLFSALAASDSGDTSDLIWPNAEIFVWMVAVLTSSALSGAFSSATN